MLPPDRNPRQLHPGPPATGLPCGSNLTLVPKPAAFSMCVIALLPDGEPDDILDGQNIADFPTYAEAEFHANYYARHPEKLPAYDVPDATLIVVNDRTGTELLRLPILGLVAVD